MMSRPRRCASRQAASKKSRREGDESSAEPARPFQPEASTRRNSAIHGPDVVASSQPLERRPPRSLSRRHRRRAALSTLWTEGALR